jgi:hypothetical protein
MISKTNLQKKTVLVKIDGMDKAFTAVVSNLENDGIWFVGGDVASQIASAIGALPLALKEPAFYVPISQISWLMASNEH